MISTRSLGMLASAAHHRGDSVGLEGHVSDGDRMHLHASLRIVIIQRTLCEIFRPESIVHSQ